MRVQNQAVSLHLLLEGQCFSGPGCSDRAAALQQHVKTAVHFFHLDLFGKSQKLVSFLHLIVQRFSLLLERTIECISRSYHRFNALSFFHKKGAAEGALLVPATPAYPAAACQTALANSPGLQTSQCTPGSREAVSA
ncbi:hypothetical protein D3C71_1484430 [compost metagenome]